MNTTCTKMFPNTATKTKLGQDRKSQNHGHSNSVLTNVFIKHSFLKPKTLSPVS